MAFTISDVMKATGLGRTTIWKLEKQGYLKAVPGIGAKLYSRKNLEAYLNGETAR